MSEMRYYTVTQEREIKVWANNPADAAQVADAKFSGHAKPDGVAGEATTPIRDRDLVIREDY